MKKIIFVILIISFLLLNIFYVTASPLEDKQNYIKIITKGLQHYAYGYYYEGFAETNYVDASTYYESAEYAEDFTFAKSYADYADSYYGYASNSYRTAKEYFEESLQYATNEKLQRLSQTYVDYLELMSQIANEMHEANEYFSSACNYYSLGYYDSGDSSIETMNIHIRNHDNLIFSCNDKSSEIDALLDNFYILESETIVSEDSYITLVLIAFIFCIVGLVIGRISKKQRKEIFADIKNTNLYENKQEQTVEQKIIKCWNCNKTYLTYRKVCPYCKQKPKVTICQNCNKDFAYSPNPYGVKQITCPHCGQIGIIQKENE